MKWTGSGVHPAVPGYRRSACDRDICCVARRLAFQNLCNRPHFSVVAGVRVVLNNLSAEIRECLQHAEDCARKAAAQTDPKLKEDFLEMETAVARVGAELRVH
jgi:hypothetical protein